MHNASQVHPAGQEPTRRLLFIGAGGGGPGEGGDVQIALPLARLSAQALAEAAPDLVIFPLISPDQDAQAVVDRLCELGYRGACLVLCPALPNPDLIEAELRQSAPGLQISLRVAGPPS